jgi:hypothetical protein
VFTRIPANAVIRCVLDSTVTPCFVYLAAASDPNIVETMRGQITESGVPHTGHVRIRIPQPHASLTSLAGHKEYKDSLSHNVTSNNNDWQHWLIVRRSYHEQ